MYFSEVSVNNDIIWNNADLLSIKHLGAVKFWSNYIFLLEMHIKMSFAKLWSFCSDLKVLISAIEETQKPVHRAHASVWLMAPAGVLHKEPMYHLIS